MVRPTLLIAAVCCALTASGPLLATGSDVVAPFIINGSDGTSLSLALPATALETVAIEGQSFHRIRSDGEGLYGAAGAPAIPAWSRWIEVPTGMRARLEVSAADDERLTSVRLAPSPVYKSDNPNVTDGAIDAAAYATDRFLPEGVAALSEPVVIGDRRYIMLDLTPYRYNAARQELLVSRSLEANVVFEVDPAAPAIANSSSPAWREVTRALSGDAPRRDEPAGRADILGHYVIIVANNQQAVQALQPLAEWRRRMGYLVTIATTAEAGNSADQIRGWFRNAFRDWPVPPTHVLLAGGAFGDLRLPYFMDGQAPQQSWYVSDQQYVTIDGNGDNDLQTWIPEAFVGRFPVGTVEELQHLVAKTIGYERTPFVESNWVEGAVLIAQGVRSCIHTNVAVRELMMGKGVIRDRFFEAYSDYPDAIDVNNISRGVNEGVGFVNFRGYNNWGNVRQAELFQNLRNGWKLPVVFGMVCGTNDFPQGRESPAVGNLWVNGWSGNSPFGAVASYGPTDLYTYTWFNNTHSTTLFHELFYNDVHTLGPLTVLGKLALWRNYPSSRRIGNGHTVGYYFYSYNILGDPALRLWTKTPVEIEVAIPQGVRTGTTLLDFAVTREGDEPVSGAYIHLINGNIRLGGYTDADGQLHLNVPPLAEGEYLVTVVGPNIVPLEGELEVTSASRFVSFGRYSLSDEANGEVEGNGDGRWNPGETINLAAFVRNTGQDALQNVRLAIDTDNPYVVLLRPESPVGDLDAGAESAGGNPFLIHLLHETPHGETVEFRLSAAAGDDRFLGRLELTVVGYDLTATRVAMEGDRQLLPGTTQRVVITLTNGGQLATLPLDASLYCSDPNIQIRLADSFFDAVPVGEARDNRARPFEVSASARAYMGIAVPFGLLLSDEEGRVDSVIIPITLGPVGPTSPQGPDMHGYWAFDSRDTTTGMAPRFERITGTTSLNLVDNDDRANVRGDAGSRAIVNLPFEFVYYGQRFRRITVGSNGWVAMGESDMIAWNNQELGSPIAPAGLIAPFWEDLWSGQVYTRYDQDNGRFIIEWRNYQSVAQGAHTFSVVLYDPTARFTRTGDGEIEFHYISIPQQRDYEEEAVTVGLSSPDRRIRLQLAHAGVWHPASSGALANERAIRFTTGELSDFGGVRGRVTDAATGQPLQGVRVMLEGTGYYGTTDAGGAFTVQRAPIGTYTVVAQRRHFNPASAADIQIETDQFAEIDFSLTHPEYRSDVEEITIYVPPQQIDSTSFNVFNDGNGPLDFDLRLNYEARRDAPWDILFDWNVSALTDNNTFLQGVTTDGNVFYIAGKTTDGNLPHWIYRLDRDGNLIDRFPQVTVDTTATRGYYGIGLSPAGLLCTEKNNVVLISSEGEHISTIPSPHRPSQSVCAAPERGTFFVKGVTQNDIAELDYDGQVVALHRTPEQFRTYGMAWHPADPDGYPLYIFRDNGNIEMEFGTRMQIMKMNPDNNDVRLVRNLVVEAGDVVQDCAITKRWDHLKWVFVALINRPGGDHLIGFEIGPNLTWISYDPKIGTVEPDASQAFNFRFSPEDMPEGRYFIVMEMHHNAFGDRQDIPVNFIVGWDEAPASEIGGTLPTEFAIEAVYPNPFNPAATIRIALPVAAPVEVRLFDAQGRLIRELDLGRMDAGRHSLTLEGADLPSGIYLTRVQAGKQVAIRKAALVR